jgi:hypothetical protein
MSPVKVIATIVACAAATAAQAEVIAYWNFNTLTTATNNGTSYAPTSGAATLDVLVASSDQAGTSRGINSFAGTTVNALFADPAGQALAIQASSLESGTVYANNGATITITFSMTDLADPILTFASQRTSTGFNANQLAWSTDGVNFTDFGSTYTPATSFALVSFDLSTVDALDNAPSVTLRLTVDGATSTGGNNRFDNIQINAVPTPGALALMGLGGLIVARRRR